VVQYVGFAVPLKYLLVVLKPGFGGKQLAALQPDVAAMADAVPASEITGVIVAAAAAPGRRAQLSNCNQPPECMHACVYAYSHPRRRLLGSGDKTLPACCCCAGAHACAGDGADLYARFFGPWAGIDEDPVTGSAYTVVAPYFSSAVFGGKKQQMVAKQLSARGGTLQLDLGVEPGRVVVSGKANMGPGSVISV
jgi:hypothetical protein